MNLTTNQVNVQNFMIVPFVSNAPKGLIQTGGNEPCTTGDGGQVSTQRKSTNTVREVHYNTRKRWDKQEDRHNAVKKSDHHPKSDCREDPAVSTITSHNATNL